MIESKIAKTFFAGVLLSTSISIPAKVDDNKVKYENLQTGQ
ncbi:hypothetical protein RQP50_17940 [Paenibacillus sp. chi10]|uniref:Uncharacterized protein n=1 Tax=Paenibacillus suaedae TaxID=3077233 RepID=A0AAJ2JYA5_9BACL|nr:hypothetical protein [Paenibacillus sp. chi10]MDT8978111.1 hypothetical protein [Paenibacillus sp. chi10]